jgi:hypothetical protein
MGDGLLGDGLLQLRIMSDWGAEKINGIER